MADKDGFHKLDAVLFLSRFVGQGAAAEAQGPDRAVDHGRGYAKIVPVSNRIVGFGDIDKTGYLDRLYIHKDYQRKGIAAALCDRLEQANNITKIITHASITAKGFFEKRGYVVLKAQEVERRGVKLKNFVMKKRAKT